MLRDSYPYYLANAPEAPNQDLEVVDKYSGEVATRVALADNAAIDRAKAYEQAGADGFFAPGLADERLIGRLCEATRLPVNIIALPHVPEAKVLAGLGVARISYGPVPYRRMAQWLEGEARLAFAGL